MIPLNENAPVKSKKSILIDATPQRVWELLSDINNWNKWNTDIKYAKLNGDFAVDTTFDWNSGGTKINSTLHTITPLKEIGWIGKVYGALAINNITLSNVNGKTEVWVEESLEGLLMRFFRGYMQRTLEEGLTNWLIQLKEAAE